jgi:hypothetical protein
MRSPRVRITVGGLMIWVAVAGAVTHGAMVVQRHLVSWMSYRRRAESYACSEARCRRAVAERREISLCCYDPNPPSLSPERLKYLEALASHYAKLKRKYRVAMLRPWAAVPSDPLFWRPGDGPDPLGP